MATSGTQKFGGPWSLLKINSVANYLGAFNQALSKQPFQRIYIDAFAGSGEFTYGDPSMAASLFDAAASAINHAGSAKRALETKPEFHQLTFIENDPKNVAALRALANADSKKRALVVEGEANDEVRHLCAATNWSTTRGVIFLDPFGNSVEWSTLEAIAKTKLDVWYLFPLAGLYRNAPIDKDKLTPEKRESITRILGSTEWEDAFYWRAPQQQVLLFEPSQSRPDQRHLDVDGIQAFVTKRLHALFPLVLPPRMLYGPNNAPLFSLFFAMANSSKAAQAVARPIAEHILKMK